MLAAVPPPIIAPMPADLRAAPKPVSRKYDEIFRKYGHGLPVPYLRALAKRESNLNAREQVDPAWGLLQVIPIVLSEYNKAKGTSYSRADLLDPAINTKIATDLIRRIIRQYKKNHPNTPNMLENWANPEFVKLVTAGWNSGYSEVAGVGFAARCLERKGIEVTHDNVLKYARECGATRHLYKQPSITLSWQRSVAALFYAQPDALRPRGAAISALTESFNPFMVLLPHVGLSGTLPVSPEGFRPVGLVGSALSSASGGGNVWKWGVITGAFVSTIVIGYAVVRRWGE